MAKTIMFQGTGSNVGKSVLTAGFCRILVRKGYRVAPFKSQNMALNSYVTHRGREMGRAQVYQAEAARVAPRMEMNPVLLKPNEEDNSQVILAGRPYRNMTAQEYFGEQKLAQKIIEKSLTKLEKNFEVLVLEGGGSPAEINLRDYDLVNMSIARMAEAPVILIASIEKGGVFADIVGTLELLNSEEKDRIRGIIVNKFHGDKARFKEGVEFIEEYTGKPVLGVLPFYKEMNLPEEDSLSRKSFGNGDFEIDIAVIDLPRMANFTDFDFFSCEPKTRVRFVKEPKKVEEVVPDLVIIPGTKNTVADLRKLYTTGMTDKIIELRQKRIPVVGICGGYQILGEKICDPHEVETGGREIEGLGFLPVRTTLAPRKVTGQVEVRLKNDLPFAEGDYRLSGYEIHQGRTESTTGEEPLFSLEKTDSKRKIGDGARSEDGLCWGTYLHGLFENDEFRRDMINYLRVKKGLSPLQEQTVSFRTRREKAYDDFADFVAEHLDIDKIIEILNKG